MKNIELILFDLDGTLIDPKIGITSSIQYALSHFGILEPNLSHLQKFIGPPIHESFREFYGFEGEALITAISKYRERYAKEGIYENTIYPGIPALLAALVQDGKKLVVATSKLQSFAVDILKHYDLHRYFSFIAGSNLDGSRSQKADVIRYGLHALQMPPSKKVMLVGDTKYDILGAQQTGLCSVGVLYGYGSRLEMEAHTPDYLVPDVKALSHLLRQRL